MSLGVESLCKHRVISSVASLYCCCKGQCQQRSGAAEHGTLGGPVHTPAWTQYCAYCCGVALVAFARLVCTWSQERLSVKGQVPCAVQLGFHARLVHCGEKAMKPHPITSFLISMLQSNLPGAVGLQQFWCTATRALC